jgi:hypothetical protein
MAIRTIVKFGERFGGVKPILARGDKIPVNLYGGPTA